MSRVPWKWFANTYFCFCSSGLSSGLGGSVSGTTGGKLTSLPASPFVQRASKSTSFSSHVRLTGKYGVEAAAAAAAAAAAVSGGGGRKPLVLFTYLDAQEHLPYADDSTAVTPKSELNGGIVVDTPTRIGMARKLSYNSHTGMKPLSRLYLVALLKNGLFFLQEN